MEDLVLVTERRLSSAITKLWAKIKASMAAKVHTHAISDVTNLQTRLDEIQDIAYAGL